MPRTVDVEERDRKVSEAAWRVLVRDGIPALTVRRIAAEAGLPPSSLRYTFPTQASVRVRAYELALERVKARVATIPRDDAQWARKVLLELLPLDDQRRPEMEVSLALGTAALTDRSLHRPHLTGHRLAHDLCEQVIRTHAVPTADISVETRRLHALIDGLAMHLAGQDPDDDTAWAVQVLDTHLTRLG